MEHVQIEIPSGTFHALAGAGDRPLVFLHGFPDHPPTARPLFAELAARGHRVLAPWLRGYAPSPLAPPFDLLTLAGDVIALIERWSPDAPVDLVGHDWGAVLTYLACVRAPDRIGRAVTLSVPHPRTFVRQLATPAQMRASWYQALFQLPGSSWLVRRDDFALIDRLWAAWSPGFTLPEADRRELHATLAASMPAPLEYYRDARRHPRALLSPNAPPIRTPVLALHGADDRCVLPLSPSALKHHRSQFAGLVEYETLPGLGHFLHLEAPAQIAARIASFLA